MDRLALQRTTGALFVVAVVAFLVSATALSLMFDWPDILRENPDYVLTQYDDGGTALVWVWFAVAWSYFLLLPPLVLLGRVMERHDVERPYVGLATLIGAASVIASLVGFLRWVFVLPDLVDLYTAVGATDATRAVVAAYTAQHQYGGALIGEHVGQLLAIIWSGMISTAMLRSRLFPSWLGYFGLIASAIFLLAQGEVMETAIEGFPVLDVAGLLGSTLWGLWILAVGLRLVSWSPQQTVT